MPPERRILLWMCVLVAVNQLGFGSMIPSLPLYAQSFGVPASAIGMAVAAYGLARFFTALPSGVLAERLGRRPTLAIGGIVSALGNLWCAYATSYPEFIVARFVAGAGAGLIVTTGQIVLADITTPEIRGRMLSIYQGTFIFAVGIGPFPGGLLAEHYGLAAPFIAYGFAALGATLVAWFAVSETRHFARDRARSQGVKDAAPPMPLFMQIRHLLSQTGFALASLIVLIGAVVRTGGMFAIIPVLAKDRLDLSVTAIGFAITLGSVAGLATAFPTGWLADRFGRKAVMVPATLMTGAAMLLFCLAPSYLWFLVANIAWGIAQSASGTAPAAYAADSAPPGMTASAMSIFRMMADVGYVAGPLALGLIVDLFGPVQALLSAAAMITATGLAFWAFAPESYKGSARRQTVKP